jgi:hypothetical protein
MSRKDGLLMLCIAAALCLCLTTSVVALTEERNDTVIKDPAQLKMEALEAELGEEGMKEVKEYLELQKSLPDVVKASPYSWVAFAATDKKSQIAYLDAIDKSKFAKEEKEKMKFDLQDIWNRYPDKFKESDNLVLENVSKIMEKNFIERGKISTNELDSTNRGVKWGGSIHRDYAYYACDGSAYSSNASDAADDPDEPGFDPHIYRYYNHYYDDFWCIGGAPGRCEEFADSAIFAVNNGYWATAHQRFGYSSHYLTDPGIPFHSKGAIDPLGTFQDALFTAVAHIVYEQYVYAQWGPNTTYEYGHYVSRNTRSITVTDPEQAAKDNAEHSAQYYDYITNEMATNPNWGTDLMLAYYTAQCVQESARYTHGLYDYIM